jgi:phosphoglycolate phosphatase
MPEAWENMRYQMIVWDWDGTLMDSTPTIVECIQKACADLDLPIPSDELASHVIGLGLADALRIAVPALTPERHPALVERFRYYYLAKDHELTLFKGARELLSTLKDRGHFLAVATGKPRHGLNRSLKFHQLEDMFTDTRTADETKSKPHPQMLLELSDALMVPLDKMLMIGDTSHDLNMALNAGVDAVAVTYGAHPANSLRALNPVKCVDTVEELAHFLLTQN